MKERRDGEPDVRESPPADARMPTPPSDGDDAWEALERRLAPLESLVPPEPPPWRIGALALTTIVGVGVAGLVSLLAVVSLEHVLFPQVDAAELTHAIALGVSVAVGGGLSVMILGVAARVTVGRAAQLDRRDLALAAVVFALLAAWTVALHAWVVGVAGYVELDLISLGTRAFAGLVVLVTVALVATPLTRARATVAVLAAATIGIAALTLETISNALGAFGDGEVSAAGVAVGALSAILVLVLSAWAIATTRARFAA
jgi:hypothetical protein